MPDSIPSALKIAVVGGGIAGLAAAHTIARARESGAPVDELLLEASGRWGGLIRTERFEGFTLEGGPDSFLSTKPEASALCKELGLEAELIGSNDAERETYIVYRGKLEPLPEGLMFFVPARLRAAIGSPLIPFGSKLAILRDAVRFQSARLRDGDESVADFVRRHLGSGVLETLVDPLLAGVYGGDSAGLSVQAALPTLVEMERRCGSVVRGAIRARKPASSPPIFTTLRDGLEELPRALVAQLKARAAPQPPRLVLDQCVESIKAPSQGAPYWRQPRYQIYCRGGTTYVADAVILALPAAVCARLLEPLDRQLSENLGAIPYTPAVTISLAYRGLDRPLPRGFGLLVSRREGRQLLAVTFVHAKFSHRAPPGCALLRCFLGGSREPDVVATSDDRLLDVVRGELGEILGIRQAPVFHRIVRWPLAMPQYLVGHPARVAQIERAAAEHEGLFLAGGAYHGIGISDCIRSGTTAAEAAVEFARRATQPA